MSANALKLAPEKGKVNLLGLAPERLALHELDPVRGTVAFRDNGPLFAGA